MKIVYVILQWLWVVVMEAFHGRVLDRAVHPFNLAVGPWMLQQPPQCPRATPYVS